MAESARLYYRNDRCRDILGSRTREVWRIGMQNFCHTRNIRSCLGNRASVVACDEERQLAADLLRRGDGIERRRIERCVIVVGEKENRHGVSDLF